MTILHTNDFHGALTLEKADRIRAMKDASGALFFDSGDCIKTGNLGIPVRHEPVWGLLHRAGIDASVPGNRESHVLETAFQKKIDGAQHPILCANWNRKRGEPPFARYLLLERDDVKIGVFGVMVPMVTARMKTQAASAFLWDPPIETAAQIATELRSKVDLLIALTHIGLREDLKLAAAVPSIDLILGGHSHSILDQPEQVGATWVCQGGSHGRFVGRYQWAAGMGLVAAELIPL